MSGISLHLSSQLGWLQPFFGGMLIGLGALLLLASVGRIAGISGISNGLLHPKPGDWLWRLVFIVGLLMGAWLLNHLLPSQAITTAYHAPLWVIAAGMLVGLGAVMANGCTSGHGVCGLARLSSRSMAAVAIFMSSAIITVWLVRHVF